MKSAYTDAASGFGIEARLDPFPHLIAGVRGEGQQEQLLWHSFPSMEKPSHLRHDNRSLAAAGRRDYQIPVLIDNDRPTLLLRQWSGLNRVQQFPRVAQFTDKVCVVGLAADIFR